MRKTKIICTLGPASDTENVLHEMILAGMDVARINFSHGIYEEHKKKIDLIKKLREKTGKHIALLLDTKGPEVRTGCFKEGRVTLRAGQDFTLTVNECDGTDEIVSVSYKDLPKDVEEGTRILIDDGLIALTVKKVTDTDILCRVINGGEVSNRKGINIPGVRLSMPFLSDKDKSDLAFGVEQGFDFIAASFTRTAKDIADMRDELERLGCNDMRIIAKIENAEGVENMDDILRVADGIMVARGDMGVEIAYEDIPIIQKKMISRCYMAGKQVITATQMLESMKNNPRPTRAEANDVANAIYDGTSAIMLSGETAAGQYPVEAVRTMARIAERAETDIDYKTRLAARAPETFANVTTAISHATCTTASDLKAAAIITVTKTGSTARMISKFRPETPIIGCSMDEKICRQMNMSWGVTPIKIDEMKSTDDLFAASVAEAYNQGLVKFGDLVVITAGVPLGIPGTTNLLKVHVVGDVLAQGIGVTDNTVCGNLCVAKNEEEARRFFKDGDILVIPETSNDIMDLLRRAKGIICEHPGVNSHAAIVGAALSLPVIVGATGATKILRSGTTVTLDGKRGTVFSGDSHLFRVK